MEVGKYMKEICLGTIGSGFIVHQILNHVQRMDGIRLAAVYSRSEETGRNLAKEYGGARVYTTLEAFLADMEINTVYIASPNLLHYEQTRAALLAGKHVICEKPFCVRAAQARELVQLARERALLLVDAVPTTFLPNYKILRQELPKIGRVRLVMANYSQYSSRYDRLLDGEVPNVFNPAFGGGSLMDLNFYNLYLSVALFGQPQQAVYYPNRWGELADTSGSLILRYEDFVCQCAGAKDCWGVNYYQIEGEQGYIYITDGSNGLAEIRLGTREGEMCFNAQQEPDRWYYEVQALTELLLAENFNALEPRLDCMLQVMETLEMARRGAGLEFPGDSED